MRCSRGRIGFVSNCGRIVEAMMSFLPLRRPLLRHRQPQLSLCSSCSSSSLPFASCAVVEPVQSSPELSRVSLSSDRHRAAVVRISPFQCCPNHRSCLDYRLSVHSRRRPLVVAFERGGRISSSVDRKVLRKISSELRIVDDGHPPGGASWSGRRIGRGRTRANNKTVPLRVQLVSGYGYLRKCIHHDADGPPRRADAAVAQGASRSEGVECVQEDVVEKKSHDAALSDDDVSILANYMTRHNYVRVLEVSRTADSVLAGARVLLLDKPGNVHSIYQKCKVLTGAYYDILVALPAVIPKGPIGILGLGAGTAARLIHHFWPEIDIHGWELDPGVIQAARNFFDLEELEWKEEREDISMEDDASSRSPVRRRRNSNGVYRLWKDESDEVKLSLYQGMAPENHNGRLRVHIGDALNDPAVSVEGGFAGLVVDLFAEGAVIPALQQAETWQRMREKLRPGGRIMVNCGGSCVEAAEKKGVERKDGGITMRETIAAMAEAFPGELSITNLRDHGDNSMALTGSPPDFEVWRDTLPECLRRGIDNWRPFSFS